MSHVIVVEDDAVNATLFRTLLERRCGCRVTLTASAGGTVDRRTLAGHLTDALKVDAGTAEAAIAGLTGAGLLADDPDARVGLTGAGRAHHARIRSAVDDVVARVYGDIPAADLATAGRVLALVTERLNALR